MPYRGRSALLGGGLVLVVLLLLAPGWPAPGWLAHVMDRAIADRPRQFIEVAANIGSFVTVLIGFALVYVQLRDIHEQTELSARTARSDHYAQISSSMRELNRIFHERWDLRRYFYDGVSHEHVEEGGETAVLLDNVCEIVLDFADDVVEQYRALPDGVDWTTWWSYFRYLYRQSPKLRSFLWANFSDFYPDYILQPFGFVVVRRGANGDILGVWTLALADAEADDDKSDDDPVPRGYPWATTWALAFHPRQALRGRMEAETSGHYRASVEVRDEAQRRGWALTHRSARVALITEACDVPVPAEALSAVRGWVAETMSFTDIEFIDFLGLPERAPARWDLHALGMAARPGAFAFPNREGRG